MHELFLVILFIQKAQWKINTLAKLVYLLAGADLGKNLTVADFV